MDSHLNGTTFARWSTSPARSGRCTCSVTVPRTLRDAMADRALQWRAGTDALLLAAHIAVLQTVTGEARISTCMRDGATMLAVAVEQTTGSWRELVEAAAAGLVRARPAEGRWATVLDVAGGDPAPGNQLHIAYSDGRLRLSYRAELLAPQLVERIGGYYLAALRAIASVPDRPRQETSLLGQRELSVLLAELAGPPVALPERMFVAQFEDQAKACPDAPAVTAGAYCWSYRELDRRANQIAHMLRERGLAREQVVATVLGRTPQWIASIIGIFKAGGVYLPVRPDFPVARISTQLERGKCQVVLTDQHARARAQASVAQLTRACPVLDVGALAEVAAGRRAIATRASDAAYIYFTSGSTGSPKGAMCEHGGMINHLLAKIDDLKLGPHQTVAQLASQCFDISLWQVLAPLLVGGTTAIVDEASQLDVEGFLDWLAAGGVHVVQVVPSYLDAMLMRLERRPRALGDLRWVSVTGEAFTRHLAQRWFARCPQIGLLNAYGTTEVSDDTLHGIFHGMPDTVAPVMPIGRPIRNVHAYVLDPQLRLAPLGAPGELAFAGVCVGRGYVGDPQRTAEAYRDDPYRPGRRLYLTGDVGRWLPDGTLEFLGRRDEQIKIDGFRIELGEIESRMLAMPDISAAAVVVDSEGDRHRLVAFYTASADLSHLREALGAVLPAYMVPGEFHRLTALPLTENGKVDKQRLVVQAAAVRRSGSPVAQAPASPAERRLAQVWSEVLAVDARNIDRHDDFFTLGGTSLAAVRLAIRLDQAVTLEQIVAHPVLYELAAVLEEAGAIRGRGRPG